MKKSLFVSSVLFLLLGALRAQNKNESNFKRFGFRAGVNFSHVNFAKGVPPPVVPIETNWKAGINIGFLMMVKIADDLYFQPEYAYSQMGGKVKNSDSAYTLNYFSMPLLLKYQVHEKFSLMVGPQFDLLINAKKNVKGNSINITHDTEERSLAAVAGVEYHLTSTFSICARYMLGFNHIGLGQRSDVQEFKYETAQLMACVRF
ncbi:MAG: porin family protein [Ferruginibacter sp.]